MQRRLELTEPLLRWYRSNRRILPWRETSDPYNIWLSEIILQQTRVDQGLPYYHKFIARFPDVFTLAQADPDDVLHTWQGLGYYSRARNLHRTANVVATDYKGSFPESFRELRLLPGIGDYTAAAIASIAFSQPEAAVDGNVIRVLSRFTGTSIAPDTSAGKAFFRETAFRYLDRSDPGTFNQAMMELGALICKPKSPLCMECPVATNCTARAEGNQHNLPVRSRKPTVRHRYFRYILLHNSRQFLAGKREENDIWKGLYQLPLFETGSLRSDVQDIAESLKLDAAFFRLSDTVKHVLTHQVIHCQFYEAKVPVLPRIAGYKPVGKDEIAGYPFPRLLSRYFAKRNWQI